MSSDDLIYPDPDINIEICELFLAVSRGDVDHEEAAARTVVIAAKAYGQGHIDRARLVRNAMGLDDKGRHGNVVVSPPSMRRRGVAS